MSGCYLMALWDPRLGIPSMENIRVSSATCEGMASIFLKVKVFR